MANFFTSQYNFRKLKKPQPMPISQEELFELSNYMTSEQDKVLLCFLYLTGCRISEALRVQVRDMELSTVNLPSGRIVKAISINMITLKKKRGIPRRTVYVNLVGLDLKMYEVVNSWRNKLPMEESYLFNYGDISKNTNRARWVAYHRMAKIKCAVKGIAPPDGRMVDLRNFHLYNHYMRHCRAYHLKTIYRLNGDEAKAFFGWSSSALWDRYGSETATDVLERLVSIKGGIDVKAEI
jgi:integrase